MVPELVYGPKGSAHPATDTVAVLRVLRAVPELRVGPTRPTRVGGLPGRTVELTLRASARPDDICAGPCVAIVSSERVTQTVTAPAQARLTVLDVHGRTVSILEDTPNGDSLALTAKLVRSLRFP
jgi:hypothetical protein